MQLKFFLAYLGSLYSDFQFFRFFHINVKPLGSHSLKLRTGCHNSFKNVQNWGINFGFAPKCFNFEDLADSVKEFGVVDIDFGVINIRLRVINIRLRAITIRLRSIAIRVWPVSIVIIELGTFLV